MDTRLTPTCWSEHPVPRYITLTTVCIFVGKAMTSLPCSKYQMSMEFISSVSTTTESATHVCSPPLR